MMRQGAKTVTLMNDALNAGERKMKQPMNKIIVRKKPMTGVEWHYCQSLNSFIKGIEDKTYTNTNIQIAFFVKDNPITKEGEIYYEPAITSLNTDYLREMRDKLNFKIVMVFGGGGIENDNQK